MFAAQQGEFRGQQMQAGVIRAARDRFIQRGLRFVRTAVFVEERGPGEIGEHVVRIQLEAAPVPRFGCGGVAEQVEVGRDLQLQETHALRCAHIQVRGQRLGDVALSCLQVRGRRTAAVGRGIQLHGARVAVQRGGDFAAAIVCIRERVMCSGGFRLSRNYGVCQRQRLRCILGIAAVETQACAVGATQAELRGAVVRCFLQALPVQRDRALVVRGLADGGVVRRTFQ
ncbi:hypothetical protein [Luteimonas cellulosilyticus]|uniref:hypothetical protein n=1 Tax=Luteimonas cellulosilyticus TaxID=2683586 RepID=UPI001F1B5226|nr:hypothetical protein [Luteimonas cellulosilyticus]